MRARALQWSCPKRGAASRVHRVLKRSRDVSPSDFSVELHETSALFRPLEMTRKHLLMRRAWYRNTPVF